MTNQELSSKILELVGGRGNVNSATNCMTRVRIHVKDDGAIQDAALKNVEGVLGLVHDNPGYVEVVVGPGKCRKVADIYKDMGIPVSAEGADTGVSASSDWKANKAAIKGAQKESKVKAMLKTFGEIFVPLIPGVIAAGICSGLATLLAQAIPNYTENAVWNIIYNLLSLINTAFMTYITAWAGYRAAEKFGGTPILGGMVGMITTLGNIDAISKIVGLYNEAQPLDAILRAGRGGVLAVVIGVWFMCKIEKAIRSKMPDAVDICFTPILTLIITLIPYIFIVMPVTGLISTGLCKLVELVAMSTNPVVRMVAGYLGAALFLPMVAMGMHHGLVALYTVQLEAFGYVTLYPALAMAGAGQVGAAIALSIKAKRTGNHRLRQVIGGALPAGILGVGEPLIYGVTLPMGKPFFTAGLGAGFGGAFVMLMQVAATTWGPSGLLGIFVMTAGPNGAILSIIYFLIGLVISYIMGFIFTWFGIKEQEVAAA
ncbi:PTS transporter subunit EIIC [Pseudoflavonifractor intestinihominis]|uniref:PTS transporter subunit EIIC n=1 Tax=Pseudoflavonifractor intestinihominis TaxID=3133171 RepID=A0ABV1E8U2_9FIRM|nr:PTS transporter subunit EIIC [uncultured Pseudoflavonifractor sp.]